VSFLPQPTQKNYQRCPWSPLGAFATFGISKSIKTDNDPIYTRKKLQKFCKLWDIPHNTGIPYNPQGQAIVE
jgi:hypothetical protein